MLYQVNLNITHYSTFIEAETEQEAGKKAVAELEMLGEVVVVGSDVQEYKGEKECQDVVLTDAQEQQKPNASCVEALFV